MKFYHKERLLKLAKHLEKGKLGHKTFDFRFINEFLDVPVRLNKCGTNGCACGELPIVFKDDFKFALGGIALKAKMSSKFEMNAPSVNAHLKWFYEVCWFLGLSERECEYLFLPNNYNELYGGKELGDFASRKDVASNIKKFIEYKEIVDEIE